MKELLLQGAVYALQNSGALLRDAVALYHRGSYASAVVMTLFAREELGKYRILRGECERVAAGGTLQPADLVSKKGPLFNHVEKQKQAVMSIVQRADRDSPLGKAILAVMDSSPGSPAREKAEKELAVFTEAQARALPKERHDRRMDALYVGLNGTQTGWIRPQEVTQEEAKLEVYHAVNDYNNALALLEMEPPAGKAFLEAFYAWTDRPHLSAVGR
jgi:AbiV family abortive infection protein